MGYWAYGAVKNKKGKISIWEIHFHEEGKKTIVWGSPAVKSWMLKEIILVIKDLYSQYKYMKHYWSEEDLKKGMKEIGKVWAKEIKAVKSKLKNKK